MDAMKRRSLGANAEMRWQSTYLDPLHTIVKLKSRYQLSILVANDDSVWVFVLQCCEPRTLLTVSSDTVLQTAWQLLKLGIDIVIQSRTVRECRLNVTICSAWTVTALELGIECVWSVDTRLCVCERVDLLRMQVKSTL